MNRIIKCCADRLLWAGFVLALIIVADRANAQNEPGAPASSMAGSYLVMHDTWSAFHNQAGLVYLQGLSAGAFYENRFGLNELSDKGFVCAMPLGNNAFALSFRSFGYSQFNISKTSLAYALKFSDKFSGGVQFNYHNTRIGENYGSQSSLTVEGGFLYKMNERISLAAHIANPNRARLSDFNDERMPSVVRIGAGYRFSQRVILTAEVRKPSDTDASVRAGLEYHPIEPFYIRAGFGSDPARYAFGFGWKFKAFTMDVATGYHQMLGFSPQISLLYSMPAK